MGLQPLLVERSFLEIMFRGAGDINNPNNILGFEGKINGNENLPGRNPVENNFLWWWHEPNGRLDPNEFFVIMLQLRLLRNELYFKFSKIPFLIGYMLILLSTPSFRVWWTHLPLVSKFDTSHRGPFISFLNNGYNRINVYYSLLGYFLDIIGEAINADQDNHSKYAMRKLAIYF